jgi:hypothetical protein
MDLKCWLGRIKRFAVTVVAVLGDIAAVVNDWRTIR